MKTKNFFLTEALMLVTALTGMMMTSCSKIDIPVADNDSNPPLPKGKIVNLSEKWTDYVAVDGDTLTGLLNASCKLSIADGATVTLSGVTIQDNTKGSCITCEGYATIVLADNTKNILEGNSDYSGIQAGPKGTTLTICGENDGTGELTATGGVNAAGIGSRIGGSCGDITIEGGTINAYGGVDAAGIGSGQYGSCGDITIEGGKITATGGDGAVGIGTGLKGSCDKITIRYPASGTAIGGLGSTYDIGAGTLGTCGEILVEAETIKGSWNSSSPEDAPIGGGTGDSPIGGEGTIIVHAGAK